MNCLVRRWFCVILGPKPLLHRHNSKTQNAFLSPVLNMFHHDCPQVVKPASMPWCLIPKQTWRDSLPIDVLLSAVSVVVVALPSSEVLEGLMNYPVYVYIVTWMVNAVSSPYPAVPSRAEPSRV
jgi:hypothetical protein